jgi:formylglycine-generating enzyme required for sulfatase activity
MQTTSTTSLGLAALAGIALILPATAAVTIDWVLVGNAGNPNDTTGYGAVNYTYKIAKNETTIGQYVEFLNATAKSDPYSLYNTNMATAGTIAGISRSGGSGSYSYAVIGSSANKPITYVSWFDAARFCNWLHNGQGGGSTETGAYTLNGAMSGIYNANPGAKIWLPTENEWYKAAYYDPTKGGAGGYWAYATRRATMPGNTIGMAGAANYFDGDYVGSGTSSLPTANALTNVGAYGANSASYYGTNDQTGNVWEWNGAVVNGTNRGQRGGSWGGSASNVGAVNRFSVSPTFADNYTGFRIAAVPEPAAMFLTLLSGGLLLIRRRRCCSLSRCGRRPE